MTLPLRQRHRRIFAGLTVFLPAVFLIGIAARRPVPAVSALPEILVGAQPIFQSTLWKRSDLFQKTSLHLSLLREDKEPGRYALGFSAPTDFTRPDLIVYWVGGAARIGEALPDNALLLGTFDPEKPLLLPTQLQNQEGILVLYSLADGEIVDVSRPFRFDDSTH